MNQQDPLRRNRLGLRGVLLVSGGVLVLSSAFLLPGVGFLQGPTATTDLSLSQTAGGSTRDDTASAGGDAALRSTAGVSNTLLPVYWVGDVNGDERLFREFVTSPEAAVDPIAESVRLMTMGDPLDPDYRSPWREAGVVRSSISTQNVITVDLPSNAVSEPLPEDEARLAVQQLVHTATAAAANAGLITGGEASSVVVLVDGAAGHRAFGSVDLDGEWTRDPDSISPVWIIDPQEDVDVDGPLTVHGQAPASAGEVRWRIERLSDDGSDGGSGSSSDSASGDGDVGTPFRNGLAEIQPGDAGAGTYSLSETLPAGRYEVVVSATVDDGEAEDTKTVTVR